MDPFKEIAANELRECLAEGLISEENFIAEMKRLGYSKSEIYYQIDSIT